MQVNSDGKRAVRDKETFFFSFGKHRAPRFERERDKIRMLSRLHSVRRIHFPRLTREPWRLRAQKECERARAEERERERKGI